MRFYLAAVRENGRAEWQCGDRLKEKLNFLRQLEKSGAIQVSAIGMKRFAATRE
jgi:hypothetical protein